LIFPIVRTALVSLRRDRAALALSFILPIAFFSIFAVVFGGRRDSTPRITVIFTDEDHSAASANVLKGLEAEGSLTVLTRPAPKKGVQQPEYTAASAEIAVKEGVAPVAVIVPAGFGANPVSFGGGENPATIELLKDSSDMVAPQVIAGLLQKVAMTSMPEVMVAVGSKYMDQYAGGLTAEQRKRMTAGLEGFRRHPETAPDSSAKTAASSEGGILPIKTRDVVGANKRSPMVSFYAAATGVMFLLFTASGAAGALLDEADNGTLDRVLSSRVTMTTLLAGKFVYSMLLAFSQLVLMFVWGWAVFKLDLLTHIPGFVVMGLSTAFAVGAFGLLLAGICRTRAQLGALSTLVILIMSSIGGSMFPRFLMPEAVQKAGLFTINAWAIDGFTKVFWRDEPVSHLWPQVSVLLAIGVVLLVIARKLAQRWEYS
jgi:ABC-2 type transport system permease protein